MMFGLNDFKSFMDLLSSLTSSDFKYEIGGSMNVILKNNCSTVGLSLTQEESHELMDLMAEGMLLHQANRIIAQLPE